MLAAMLAQTAGPAGSVMDSLGSWGPLAAQLFQIIAIDIVLAGDNAVVIALACRSLPPHQRQLGIMLGAGVAVAMRIVFAVFVTLLMGIPWLKFVGALLLFWIAVKLVSGEESGDATVDGSTNLWGAVRTVAIADLVMSLDNVIAIAAVAKGNYWLLAFGVAVSIPLVVAGATLIMSVLTRYPILIWAGAALLGYIAGDLLLSDPATKHYGVQIAQALGTTEGLVHKVAGALGALFVVGLGWLLQRRHAQA